MQPVGRQASHFATFGSAGKSFCLAWVGSCVSVVVKARRAVKAGVFLNRAPNPMLQGALVATPHSLLPAVVAVAPHAVQMARRHAKRRGARSLPDTMQKQNSCSGLLLLAEPPARLHIKAHQPSANPSAPGEGGRKKDIKRNSESKQFGETQHAAVWAPRPAMVSAGRLETQAALEGRTWQYMRQRCSAGFRAPASIRLRLHHPECTPT